MKLFLRLSQDRYENILDFDESLIKLAERWGDKPKSVMEYMAKVKAGTIHPDHPKYVSIDIEADAEVLESLIERCIDLCKVAKGRPEAVVRRIMNYHKDMRELPEAEYDRVYKLIYKGAFGDGRKNG